MEYQLQKKSQRLEVNRGAEFFNHLSTFQQFTNTTDRIRWLLNSRDVFSISSYHRDLTREENPQGPWQWKQIRCYIAPYKVAFFTWIVSIEVCVMHESLQKEAYSYVANVGKSQRTYAICFCIVKLLSNCGTSLSMQMG